jgi:signal transduction histidine kinase
VVGRSTATGKQLTQVTEQTALVREGGGERMWRASEYHARRLQRELSTAHAKTGTALARHSPAENDKAHDRGDAMAGTAAHLSDLPTFNGLPRSTIHELRSPLTSIRGYAQLLLRGANSQEQAERACETIVRESDRLAGFLDQLSLLADVTIGQRPSGAARFDLDDLLNSTVAQSTARWPDHNFVYTVRACAEVEADRIRIGQLLACLLDNAAAYSHPGSTIEAWVELEGREAVAAVRDEGIGIPTEEREAVFECFRQASNAWKADLNSSRGLGVSLFLARAAAAEAGGRIWADSELERGSTFYLVLPLAIDS